MAAHRRSNQQGVTGDVRTKSVSVALAAFTVLLLVNRMGSSHHAEGSLLHGDQPTASTVTQYPPEQRFDHPQRLLPAVTAPAGAGGYGWLVSRGRPTRRFRPFPPSPPR